MTREEAHKLVDMLFNELETTGIEQPDVAAESAPDKVLPSGKRAVRTKSSGDRVYILDDTDESRRWATNENILKEIGFELSDVIEVSDEEMMKYKMGPAIFKVD